MAGLPCRRRQGLIDVLARSPVPVTVVPDPTTAFLDPFTEAKTLVLVSDIRDPVTAQAYSRDVRHIARKAEAYLESSGIGDVCYFGPELEHFIFNDVRYDQGTNYA